MTRARLIATAALAAAALATQLAGCAAVGPNFQQPSAPAGAGYHMAGDADVPGVALTSDDRPAGAWWRALGSSQLDAVMTQALADNRTVAEADANLEAVRQQAISVRGQQLPQVDLSAGAEEERINIAAFGFSGFPNPTLSLYSIGGTVSYDADLFGGRRRASEEALAQAQSQARHADAAYLTLTGQTAMAALEIAATRAQIAAVDQAVADDKHLIDIVRQAQEAGGEAPSATISGRTQLDQDEALLPPLQQQLAQSRHALALLVGQSPSNWTPPDFDLAEFTAPSTIPVSLPSALIRRRPDILAAEADLHAATADVGVNTAALYPDIKLSANLIQTALTPANLFSYANSGWVLGAGLTQPVFHGGSLKANQRAAQARMQGAMAHYQATVLAAFTQVADTMQAIANDDASITALTRARNTAQANLDDQQNAFKLGGGALLPVIDAERQLVMVRRTLVMAEAKRTADVAQLFVATAADWRDAG